METGRWRLRVRPNCDPNTISDEKNISRIIFLKITYQLKTVGKRLKCEASCKMYNF